MFISGNSETGVPELSLASIPYMGSPEGLRHFYKDFARTEIDNLNKFPASYAHIHHPSYMRSANYRHLSCDGQTGRFRQDWSAHMHSILSQPYTSLMSACWTLVCIPRLLATHGLHLITGTATSAHGSCESRPVRQIRFAAHFFPHTRPQDTHALEVGDACLECQGSLVNTYCTSAVYRPRGRARPPSAYCDLRTFSLTRSDAGVDLPSSGPGRSYLYLPTHPGTPSSSSDCLFGGPQHRLYPLEKISG
jgi:hypothetical protein